MTWEERNVFLGEQVSVARHVELDFVKTGSRGRFAQSAIVFGSAAHPVTFGDDFYCGAACYCNGVGGLTVGNRVTISAHALIFTDSGPNTSPLLQRTYPLVSAPVVIGDDVWIGAGAVIMPGVTIGSGSVIGANSFVAADVPVNSVAAGSPARVIKRI